MSDSQYYIDGYDAVIIHHLQTPVNEGDATCADLTIQAQGNNSATNKAGDLVLEGGANQGAGDGGDIRFRLDGSPFISFEHSTEKFINFENHATDTGATAGSNGDVPVQVAGYLRISIGATRYKIPYYND